MMHLCIVATLCFFKIISPRNYYFATRTIFPGSMVQSMYLNLTIANSFRILYSRCQKFPYLSKYKYQQSSLGSEIISPHFLRVFYRVDLQLYLRVIPKGFLYFVSSTTKRALSLQKCWWRQSNQVTTVGGVEEVSHWLSVRYSLTVFASINLPLCSCLIIRQRCRKS